MRWFVVLRAALVVENNGVLEQCIEIERVAIRMSIVITDHDDRKLI